ncbi:MFS general substrate transporter [Saccharata proteae CBS 121410]|uniref:MFS general substrate transporter n=1 Tax=Saccharata proteae CBS 121410 TaxID=1314787 RepID=A0A9P4LWP8_9PEZI|nr:MFS general substrate transporter [Saccharata proteae CBS 121410]
MSLAHRTSSMESFEPFRGRSCSPTGSQRRKLSFNPVGTWEPEDAREVPVGAFDVSKTKRIFQVAAAVLYCLLAAGIVFGYAALKPVLIAEGVYRDRCTTTELSAGVTTCYEQEIRLNLMFTVAAVSTNVCALPVGTLLDRYGPRLSGFVGVFFLTLGALFFAFAADVNFDAYIPAYLFLALGGPFVFISSFQLSNTFPRYSGLILALLTGAFDTSSAVFLIYRLIYQATDGAFTPKRFFLGYLVVPAYILLVQIFLMPSQSYKTVGELITTAASDPNPSRDSSDEATALLGDPNAVTQTAAEEERKSRSGVWGALHGKPALRQIRTPWFVLITLFTTIQMTRINYFVATIRPQYASLLSPALSVSVNNVFDILLPLGGVVSVPLIGLILDNAPTVYVLGLLVTLATAIGVLGVIPHSLPAAYANIALFVLYRPFYYTAVSDYAAKVFGFATFGQVYGLIICLAGLANFSQAGLDALTWGVFAGDPVPVNVLLLSVAAAVGVLLVAYVWWKSKKIHRELLEEQAEGASEVVMPGAEMEGGRGYGGTGGR